MNKNNKGFMLVEVIITATIVLTALAAFYSQFNKLYAKYNERTTYHDINGLYSSKMIFKTFLTDENFNFNGLISKEFDENNYSFILKYNETTNDYDIKSICNTSTDDDENPESGGEDSDSCKESIKKIAEFYNIKNLIISSYDSTILSKDTFNCNNLEGQNKIKCEEAKPDKDLKDELKNQTFKDYIDYIINYYDMKNLHSEDDFNYILITEIEDNNKTYYSTLRIR